MNSVGVVSEIIACIGRWSAVRIWVSFFHSLTNIRFSLFLFGFVITLVMIPDILSDFARSTKNHCNMRRIPAPWVPFLLPIFRLVTVIMSRSVSHSFQSQCASESLAIKMPTFCERSEGWNGLPKAGHHWYSWWDLWPLPGEDFGPLHEGPYLGRVGIRHPRTFYFCLTHGALIREKDEIPF